ncbi:hypothetical protein EDD21DRAFT_361580 [Dissophora ornata]|nr:hypothetical protein EDD21DRAFT_361580 [Dissophora ornata]
MPEKRYHLFLSLSFLSLLQAPSQNTVRPELHRTKHRAVLALLLFTLTFAAYTHTRIHAESERARESVCECFLLVLPLPFFSIFPNSLIRLSYSLLHRLFINRPDSPWIFHSHSHFRLLSLSLCPHLFFCSSPLLFRL